MPCSALWLRFVVKGRIIPLDAEQRINFEKVVFAFFIVMALVIMGVVSTLWMQPVMALTFNLLDLLLTPFAALIR